MAAFTDHEILVGTYEEYLLGYKLSAQLKSDNRKYDLTQNFTVKAHVGPVRCVTTGSRYAVSGGSDEQCKIYDMVKRVEHGVLGHHDGTVSCVATHAPTAHLITASDDNSVSVVKMGSWQVEKTLYKHSAGVTALALHPTGKLAFSAGKDKKLITWNLVKARPAFISHIKGIAEMIVVSPDGTRYAVGVHRRVDIYNIETAGIEYSIDMKSRPNCLVFLTNDTVVVGGESPRAEVHSLIEKKVLAGWACHDTRVRCMTSINTQTDSGTSR
jgi:protein MAK11